MSFQVEGKFLDAREFAPIVNLSVERCRKLLSFYFSNPQIPFGRAGISFLYVQRIPFQSPSGYKYVVPVSLLPLNFVNKILNLDFSLKQRQVVFCDWLTISQVHVFEDVPDINGGFVISYGSDGEEQWTGRKFFQYLGSFDSAVSFKFDSGTRKIDFSGNVSLFSESDNVFGLSFEKCICKLNSFMSVFCAPVFAGGSFSLVEKSVFFPSRISSRSYFSRLSVPHWDGATLSSIHLTFNFSVSNMKLAFLFFKTCVLPRLFLTVYPSSLVWGEKSKFYLLKIYDKAEEFMKNKRIKKFLLSKSPYHLQLLDFLKQNNVLRFELELKQRYLTQSGLRFLGALNDSVFEDVFWQKFFLLIKGNDYICLENKGFIFNLNGKQLKMKSLLVPEFYRSLFI